MVFAEKKPEHQCPFPLRAVCPEIPGEDGINLKNLTIAEG
jgi:hypothetical protein